MNETLNPIKALVGVIENMMRGKNIAPETIKSLEKIRECCLNEMAGEKKKDSSACEQRIIMAIISDAENALIILENLLLKINELSEEEKKLYIVTVHGLKSAFANIDERGLSAFAKELETAACNDNTGVLEKETSLFMEELRTLIKKYKPEDEVEISNEDAAFLKEKLLTVKSACEILDKNTANDALEAIIEKEWPKHVYYILDEIATHILHSSFKKAAAAAEGFTSRASPTRGISTW